MKKFVIDGDRFSNLEEFYTEIDKVLTKNLTWKTGHNFDAFNDILSGDFGTFGYKEPIHLIWKNFKISESKLGNETCEILTEIINCHSHIDFVKIL